MMLSRRNGVWGAALAMALSCVAGCSGNKTDQKLPPNVGGPAFDLNKGSGYRLAWATPDENTVLALSNLNAQTRVGTLERLRRGESAVVLSSGTDQNVKVSTTVPAAAVFLENVGANSVGSLVRADLATGEKKSVPGASQTFAEAFWFGPSSDRLLFIADPDETTQFGKLFWSDVENSDELGTRASPRAARFSKDGKFAVIGVDLLGQSGTLLQVDLATGVPKVIDENAQVLEGRQPAFSISDDGLAVAYATTAGAVMLWRNGAASQVAEAGKLPGLSADGTTVAWSNAGKLIVAPAGGAASELIDVTVVATPVISPEKGFVAWFSKLEDRGGGLVGDAWVAPTNASSAPIKVGSGVSMDSLTFRSDAPGLSAVVDLVDLGGTPTYSGFGHVVAGNPAETLTRVASDVTAYSVGTFAESKRIVAVTDVIPGDLVGTVRVSPATPGEEPTELGTNAIHSSLRVASNYDRVIYLVREAKDGRTKLDDGTDFGTLYGGSPDGKTRRLESGVVFAEITPGGRALAIVGSGENAGVWSLPLSLD